MTDAKLDIWLGFAKFVLGTFVLGLVTTLVNNAIQEREIELKEQEQVGTFLEHALQSDVGVRRRFAQYFSTVTRSEALRKGWESYLEIVEAEYQATEVEKNEVATQAARTDLPAEEQERLNARLAVLEQALRPTPPPAADIAPRVYLHIRTENQRDAATRVETALEANAYVVPGIERRDSGPTNTELRYFRNAEAAEARAIGDVLRASGVEVNVRYVSGYESSTGIRARHYELWFSPAPIGPPRAP